MKRTEHRAIGHEFTKRKVNCSIRNPLPRSLPHALVEASERATLFGRKVLLRWIGITNGTVRLRAHDFAVLAGQ